MDSILFHFCESGSQVPERDGPAPHQGTIVKVPVKKRLGILVSLKKRSLIARKTETCFFV